MCRGLSRRSSERPFGPGPPGGSAAGAARTRLSNRWTERGAAVACCRTRRPAVREPALRADPHAVGPRRRGCSSRLRKGLCRGPESNTDGIHAAARMQMHEPRPVRNPGRSGLNGVCAFLSEKSCVLGTPAGGRASGFPKYRDFPPICKISGPQYPLLSGADFVPRRCVAEAAAKVAEYFVPLSSERAKAPVCLPPFPPNPQRSDR